jgi:hypothetical protein
MQKLERFKKRNKYNNDMLFNVLIVINQLLLKPEVYDNRTLLISVWIR